VTVGPKKFVITFLIVIFSVVDLKLFVTDPDSTFQTLSDPDPTFKK
jgi:hypothetical protein